MAHDVFISYSTKNKSVADAVCAGLENAAISCWMAPRDVQPGRSFAGEITRAIHGSKAMVLIFSADSNNSEQILRELELAANAHLHIVQFRIEDVTPNDDLQYYLSTPHWFDATTVPLENHLGRFTIALKTLLETRGKEMEKSVRAIPSPVAESKAAGNEKLIEQQPSPTIAAPPSPPEKIAETSGGSVAPSRETEAPIGRDISISRRKRIPVWVWLACVAILLLCSIPFILKKPSPSVVEGPRVGDLIIETEPAGAAVTLDKSPPTTAPHTFRNVTLGTHRLTITLDGYLAVEQDLRFDGANPPKIVLQPRQRPPEEIGKLSVRSNPPGALIRLDGALPQEPPSTFTKVKFGKHKLTASLDGYEPKEEDLIVDRGTATDIILQLVRSKPKPTPTPTPSPSPTPDSLKALIDEAKRYETAQDWPKYHRASLLLLQRLTTSGEPASTEHTKALQVVMEGLRTKGPALNSKEFDAYEENIKYAAHLDIMPAILILGDHLRIKNSPEAFNWYCYAAEIKHNPDAMTKPAWTYLWGRMRSASGQRKGFK
jgi:hypothetical protein